jgi:hypothetical protein
MESYVDIRGYRIKARHVPVFLRTATDKHKGVAIGSLTKTQAVEMARDYGKAMEARFMWMWERSGGK